MSSYPCVNLFRMLNRLSLHSPLRRFLASREVKNCRRLTTVSLHSRLPTTVYRLQLLPKSNLSTYKKDETSNIDQQVLVSRDGLVYPRLSDKVSSMYYKFLSEDIAKGFFSFKWTSLYAQHDPDARFDEKHIRSISRRG